MKRLLLVAVMVLVSLAVMVGFSHAGNTVRALQASANATNDAVSTLQATVNDGDEYNPYYDPDKGAVIELPATHNAGVQVKPKVYYLTVTGFTGGEAITACVSGFHMASISEIQNSSNLQYATRGTPAYDALVDGEGFEPPSDHMGWVRTGSFPLVGVPDYCDFSMSSFDQQSGTTMSRRTLWHHPSTELQASYAPSWWFTTQELSSQPESVWCAEESD